MKVKTNYLRALAISSAKKDVRYYLNGVLFEGNYMVSTDGARMTVIVHREKLSGSFIVPIELLTRFLKGVPKKQEYVDVTFQDDSFTLVNGPETVSGKVIDGRFPEWRRVIPSTLTGESSQIAPDYYKDAFEIYRLINGKDRAALYYNGNSAAVVPCGANAFHVVMPVRPPEMDYEKTISHIQELIKGAQ